MVSEAETPVANLTEVPTKTPVEIPIANTTYNQVPSPDYNSQNVVYAKKPKNKLFAVIACILAVVIVGVGGFFAYTFITAENHEEVALNYAKALANAEYDGIESRLVFDVDKLFFCFILLETKLVDVMLLTCVVSCSLLSVNSPPPTSPQPLSFIVVVITLNMLIR